MGLFDIFKKKNKNKTEKIEKSNSEKKDNRNNVKEYFKDMYLIKEDTESILKGTLLPNKHFSNIAFQVMCFHRISDEMFGTPMHLFKFSNVGPDSPVTFDLRYDDRLDIKYFMFILIDNPDGITNMDNFFSYNQIGSCDFQLEELNKN